MILKKSFWFLMILVFTACNEDSTSNIPQATDTTVTISGIVTYDFVPFKSGLTSGLDYNNISQKKIRGAVVQVLNSSNTVLGITSTDANGFYSIEVTGSTVKVRVLARLNKSVSTGQSSWDFQVKDNTNSNALYAVEESLANLGTNSTQTRNLHAPSGWGGSSYTGTRFAAPFSILDVVYEAIQKVTIAQNDATFASLDIFWSKNNIGAPGNRTLGQIETSHYGTSHADNSETAIYILGKDSSDTDEYDTAVVAHEWGHYYEDKFSRSDSTGGGHSGSELLDIRLAFGEGFGTAIGCMIIDSPLYIDSYIASNPTQNTSFGTDLEAKTPSSNNPGWFNEASVARVIYDIYDDNSDVGDSLSFGFTPIHKVFINAEKNTEAFTSIFTFITALKAENLGNDSAINAITSNENIAAINDIYGTGRVVRASENANPLYSSLNVGSSVNFTTNYASDPLGDQNKLGEYNLIKFTIPTSGEYKLNLSKVGSGSRVSASMHIQRASFVVLDGLNDGHKVNSVLGHFTSGTHVMAIRILSSQRSGDIFNIKLQPN